MEPRVNQPIAVDKNNISFIQHDGKETMTVTFKSSGMKYKYWPITETAFGHLVDAAKDEEGDLFKADFNRIKGSPTINYEKL